MTCYTVAYIPSGWDDDRSDPPSERGIYLFAIILAVGAIALAFKNIRQVRSNEEKLPVAMRAVVLVVAVAFAIFGFLALSGILLR